MASFHFLFASEHLKISSSLQIKETCEIFVFVHIVYIQGSSILGEITGLTKRIQEKSHTGS